MNLKLRGIGTEVKCKVKRQREGDGKAWADARCVEMFIVEST
jgi:hypothetical protein